MVLLIVSENKYEEILNTPKKKHRIRPLTYNISSPFFKNSTRIVFWEKANSHKSTIPG